MGPLRVNRPGDRCGTAWGPCPYRGGVAVDITAQPYRDLVGQLITAGRRAVAAGLVIGSGGNLSARLPDDDVVIVTATGSWLDELGEADFSLVRVGDGAVVGGNPAPSVELPLHLESYRVRPDVNSVIHLHPQLSVLLAALGHDIRLITTDHVLYVRRIRVAPYHHSGTPELARAAADRIADGACNCVILAHHGCSAVGDTVPLAYRRAANLEEAARATYNALLLGDTDTACRPEYRARLDLAADHEVGLPPPTVTSR